MSQKKYRLRKADDSWWRQNIHCLDACPAGVDVPRYIRAVKEGKYDEALAVLWEKLPLPTVCADACFAPCEEVCAYKQLGDPIAIRAIKRAAVDRGGDGWKKRKKTAPKTDRKVAVVGSGPAGLTATYYLASKGHKVTIFDIFPKPGGTMRYGIPRYRLPEERLERDIKEILELGVTFKGETTIGKEITMEQLKNDFDAIFLATGANGSAKILLEGAQKEGVLWGWDFLRDVRLGKPFEFQGEVVVIGGGNVAIDVALTARRLRAQKVHLFCLEKREEMPAHEWEIARAQEEGVVLHNSWGPVMVMGDHAAAGLQLRKCVRVFDDKGRFNPAYDDDITKKVEAHTIILAVGQVADLVYLEDEKKIDTSQGLISAAKEDLTTGEEGVFAGGDASTGPDSIIGAISHGRKAASSIDRYLGGDGNIDETVATTDEEVSLPDFRLETRPRNDLPLLKPLVRITGFYQVEQGISDRAAAAEAERCLRCDYNITVNSKRCILCAGCVDVCPYGCIQMISLDQIESHKAVIDLSHVKQGAVLIMDEEFCIRCGLCVYRCPTGAIGMERYIIHF